MKEVTGNAGDDRGEDSPRRLGRRSRGEVGAAAVAGRTRGRSRGKPPADADESALAIELPGSPKTLAQQPADQLEVPKAWSASALETVERVLDCLEAPNESLASAALRELVVGTAARGAVLLRSRAGAVTVVGGWGDVPAVDLAAIQSAAATRDLGTAARSGADPAAGDHLYSAVRLHHSERLILVLSGAREHPALASQVRLVNRLIAHAHWRREAAGTPGGDRPRATGLDFPAGIVVGRSPRMQRVYELLAGVIGGSFPVLLQGETGVGKEHLALTLHRSSRRSAGPFVAINCAAIPAELLEAELFGVGRGVATGVSERRGKFREAAGGTLFLDEIGDMPPPLQAKFLRVLSEREVRPLGGGAWPLEARVVAATNQDLRERLQRGEFRPDLYFRLAGYVLDVPPLRERLEDLPLLVEHFLVEQAADDPASASTGVTLAALRRLAAYGWPGNVRELEHVVRRLAIRTAAGGVIDGAAVAEELRPWAAVGGEGEASPFDLHRNEQEIVLRALRAAGGRRGAAAEMLGISRQGLRKMLKRMELE